MQTFILGGEAFLSASNFRSNQLWYPSKKVSVRSHTNDRLSVVLAKIGGSPSDSFDLSLRARFHSVEEGGEGGLCTGIQFLQIDFDGRTVWLVDI